MYKPRKNRHAGYSSSDDDDANEEPDFPNGEVTCPDGSCKMKLKYEDVIRHLKNVHHVHVIYVNGPDLITVTYRPPPPTNGGPSPSSIKRYIWVGAVIKFRRETFILHVMKQDEKMFMWVSMLNDKTRNYVCHILLVRRNKQYPVEPEKRIYWRGVIVPSYRHMGTCSRMAIENPILQRDFSFSVSGRVRRCEGAEPGDTFGWNFFLILEKRLPLRLVLETYGGGQIVEPSEAIAEWKRFDTQDKVAAYQQPEVEQNPAQEEENDVVAAEEEDW